MKSDPFPNTSARQRIINNSKQELLHDNKNQTIITVIKQNKHRKIVILMQVIRSLKENELIAIKKYTRMTLIFIQFHDN